MKAIDFLRMKFPLWDAQQRYEFNSVMLREESIIEALEEFANLQSLADKGGGHNRATQSATGWISVDRLPEKNGIYQVWDNGHEYAHLFNGKWKTLDKQGNGHDNCCGVRTRQEIFPTHWMPLPSPPELQENPSLHDTPNNLKQD